MQALGWQNRRRRPGAFSGWAKRIFPLTVGAFGSRMGDNNTEYSMKLIILLLAAALGFSTGFAAEKDTRCFEMRTYYANPGKLDDLLARFRDHTVKLFEKHGMVNI